MPAAQQGVLMVRNDASSTVDRVMGALRTSAAKALAGTARGLTAAAGAAATASRQLGSSDHSLTDRTVSDGLDGDRPERIAELVGRNARDLVAEIPSLDAGDLRRLRAEEAAGKGRKTVLDAIDRALER